jgi:predicted O-linked N-acetylglucosamine transferase (SPINDLY family)
MEQIDYRFTDSLLDSPETQKFYTEELVYLPGGLFCYKPVDFTPPVAPLPAARKGHLTFGSFNNNLKVNSYIISLWAEVLKRNDRSRLLMKFRGGDDRKVADHYLQQFEQSGIGRDRVQIYGRVAPAEHLRLYGEVDIVLDTYPFNGAVTTLESLWMGVPVISLFGGNSFLSRAGLSILSRIGLEIFATSAPEEYIAKATALAANLDELAKMRVSMRQRMAASILCDATAYAGGVEAAYRKMWHRWCRSRGTDVSRDQPLILRQNRPANGDSQFDVSTDGLSRLLLRINNAAEAGEVAGILNDRFIEAVRNMVKEDRSQISVMYELATVFCKMGQLNKAEELYKEFLHQGQDSFVYNELAHICRRAGRTCQAAEYRKKALDTDPNNTWLCSNLGMDLIRVGKTQEGIDMLRQAVEKTSVDASTNTSKDALAHSNFLLHLHYLPELDKQMILDEHKRWSRIYAPASRARTSHDNVPDPDRRLRVGYISPDFRMHPVAYFFEPLLDGRNHRAVEIYGYANVERPDNFTERLKRKFDHYEDIHSLDDEEAVRLIERDRIDILVDLAGHTGNNRLGVMTYKPAPVQVAYLGYSDTTAVQAIDFRLTDALVDPPESQSYYTETPAYLPGGFVCYRPPDYAPPVATLPAYSKQCVTFGSFNNNCKVNSLIMGLWAQILRATDNSRILLRFKGGDDRDVADHYFREFERLGISRERVAILGWKNPVEHLRMYGEVDIALDTYPWNGHTTTCEALWMGVPTISLVGQGSFLSRIGLTILSRVGLEMFTASTAEEYVGKATAFARQLDNLAEIRTSTRLMMTTSKLCDVKAFSSSVEAAYRKMWHKWCRNKGVRVGNEELRPDVEMFGTSDAVCASKSAQETSGLLEGV